MRGCDFLSVGSACHFFQLHGRARTQAAVSALGIPTFSICCRACSGCRRRAEQKGQKGRNPLRGTEGASAAACWCSCAARRASRELAGSTGGVKPITASYVVMHFASDNLLKVIRELLLPSLVQLQLLILLLKPLLKLCYGGLAGPGEADLADQLEAPAFKSLTSFSACCLGWQSFSSTTDQTGHATHQSICASSERNAESSKTFTCAKAQPSLSSFSSLARVCCGAAGAFQPQQKKTDGC